MNKKILAAGLVICSIAGSMTALAANSPFPDVPADSQSAAAIIFLKGKGIISGYSDGTFQPDNTINRAEALKLVFLARQSLGIRTSAAASADFPDVKASDWFYDYVNEAAALGVVKGYDDGKFKPANEITAAESSKIIYSGLIPDFAPETVTVSPFTDVQLDDWQAPYLDYGKKKQFIEAKADGSYDPSRAISRADFAEEVYRVLYAQSNKLDLFPLNQDWPYCNNYQQGYKIKRPFSWDTIVAGKQMIFWKRDIANGQVSFARIYPNSGVAIVALDDNPNHLHLEDYLKQIEYGSGSSKQIISLNGLPYASVFIEQSGLQDNYFEMPNGKILIIYTQVGDGILNAQLKNELRYIIASVRESSGASDGLSCLIEQTSVPMKTTPDSSSPDQIKANVLKLVLTDGKADAALGQVSDEVLIETDSIGIGTGPVDYYYSASIDLTMKIDRDSATLLATKVGKTTAF